MSVQLLLFPGALTLVRLTVIIVAKKQLSSILNTSFCTLYCDVLDVYAYNAKNSPKLSSDSGNYLSIHHLRITESDINRFCYMECLVRTR